MDSTPLVTGLRMGFKYSDSMYGQSLNLGILKFLILADHFLIKSQICLQSILKIFSYNTWKLDISQK